MRCAEVIGHSGCTGRARVCGIIANRSTPTHSRRMSSSSIDALSPVDGRYHAATQPLRALLSEAGLIRERVRVEARWLLQLVQAVPELSGSQLEEPVRAAA